MKKMIFTLFALLTLAVSASAMSYEQARNEALFLTDKMAYELNLTDAQYEAAYEINLDYLMGVTSRYDVYGPYWERRNLDLSYILFSWQWDVFRAATYFYRPLYWDAGYWHFGVYARYPHRDYFYFGRPHFYASYRGGHSWHRNGGRSFYEGRRDFYRPNGRTRDNHTGMRNSWDRGDYRGGRMSDGSSTRHSNDGGRSHNFNNGRNRSNDSRGGFGDNRQPSDSRDRVTPQVNTRSNDPAVRIDRNSVPTRVERNANADNRSMQRVDRNSAPQRSFSGSPSGRSRHTSGSVSTPTRSSSSSPSMRSSSTPSVRSSSTPSMRSSSTPSVRSNSGSFGGSRSSGSHSSSTRSGGGRR